jgi:4-hydroxy-tetrahydrodipicolinate reductase
MTTAAPSIRVAIVGLGSIGREVLAAVRARPGLDLVGVADPAFAGRDAGEVSGLEPCGVTVTADVASALANGAEVALVLSASGVADVIPAIEAAAAAGADVVSTTEDLSCADFATPELARKIDATARAAGITVVGTGVNPGFVMDRLPVTLSKVCVRVDRIEVTRVVDVATRRAPLRAKVGVGLTPDEFDAGVAARRLSHRGLPESCALIGIGLGRRFDRVQSTIEPVIEERPGVLPGRVAGLRQTAIGMLGGREIACLRLEMSLGAPNPHDRVRIEGEPPLDVLIQGGTAGDPATVGAVLSAIEPTMAAGPGLKTVLDLVLAV